MMQYNNYNLNNSKSYNQQQAFLKKKSNIYLIFYAYEKKVV